jgi:hypothetical protein
VGGAEKVTKAKKKKLGWGENKVPKKNLDREKKTGKGAGRK